MLALKMSKRGMIVEAQKLIKKVQDRMNERGKKN